MRGKHLVLGFSMTSTLLLLPVTANAIATASETDRAFVAKVSQGGTYEVEASRYAETKAVAQDVKDLAVTEVHDHTLVWWQPEKDRRSHGNPDRTNVEPGVQRTSRQAEVGLRCEL